MVAHLFALAFKELMAEAFDFWWQLITRLSHGVKNPFLNDFLSHKQRIHSQTVLY